MRIKKDFLKKLLVSMLVILTLFNFIFSSGLKKSGGIVFADPTTSGDPNANPSTDPADVRNTSKTERQEKIDSLVSARTNGLAEAIGWAMWSYIVSGFGMAQEILYSLASSGGLNTSDVSSYITPLDIFFNKFTLVDINIFSTTNSEGEELDSDSLVYKLRVNAAFWYFIFRSIALGFLLIMLIINLIKAVSVSSSIDQKTVAKKSLKDWLFSLILVLFMHILIIFIINLNEIIIGIIGDVSGKSEIGDIMDSMVEACFSESFLLRAASLVAYALMILQTVKYLLIYIQRFLTTLFLVMISPIIPVWYSTAKTIGGRSAALHGWFREFIFNVVLQILHCVIYVVMVSVAMTALVSNTTEIAQVGDVAAAIIAILSLFFIGHAERLLKDILGFNSASTVTNNVLQVAHNNVNNAVRYAQGMAMSAAYGSGMGYSMGAASFGQNINPSSGYGQGMNQGAGFGQNINPGAGATSGAGANPISTGLSHLKNGVSSFVSGMNPLNNSNGAGNGDANTSGALDSDSNTDASNNENGNGAAGGPGAAAMLIAPVVSGGATSEANQEINRRNKNVLEESFNKLHRALETTKKVNNVEKYEETTEKIDDGIDINIGGENPGLLNEFKSAFSNLLQNNNLSELLSELSRKLDELDELKNKLGEDEVNKIENNIDNMSLEEIQAYINSLDPNSVQAQYASTYADYRQKDSLNSEMEARKMALIDEYRGKGLQIDDSLANQLMISDSGNILNRLRVSGEEVNEPENIVEPEEVVETIDIPVETSGTTQHSEDLSNSTVLADMVKDSPEVQKSAQDSLNLINMISGKVDVEGEISHGNINDFTIEVSKKLAEGAYSQSNFEEAKRKVRREGEKAVQALENYRSNPSSATASVLSPAGKEFAKLQAEAQHAGLMITEATTVQTTQTEVTSQTTESTRTYTQMPVNPNTQAVVDGLKNKKNVQDDK